MGGKPAIPEATQLKAMRNLLREEAALINAKAALNILRSKRLILASVRASARSSGHPRRQK